MERESQRVQRSLKEKQRKRKQNDKAMVMMIKTLALKTILKFQKNKQAEKRNPQMVWMFSILMVQKRKRVWIHYQTAKDPKRRRKSKSQSHK